MSPPVPGEETAAAILRSFKTWAVVGCSPDPGRDSHRVARFLQQRGYRILPVNPVCDSDDLLGEHCYDSLLDIPATEEVEVVDVFRRSEFAGEVVDQAIAIGAKAVWMQLGVVDRGAAARAEAAGLQVVMNRCPMIDLPALSI
ncbi:MAG TPA: CoA-binding protein [Actinomycetota bacterium]|nr:CoA-binding protein [Actinomycetota bacterium]